MRDDRTVDDQRQLWRPNAVAGVTCALAILSYVSFGASFIERIPMAALTGTMLCLVLDIFDWTSFSRMKKIPKTDSVVLLLVTGVTVATNLAGRRGSPASCCPPSALRGNHRNASMSRAHKSMVRRLCVSSPVRSSSVRSRASPRSSTATNSLNRVILDFSARLQGVG